jgi:hypothetical protein
MAALVLLSKVTAAENPWGGRAAGLVEPAGGISTPMRGVNEKPLVESASVTPPLAGVGAAVAVLAFAANVWQARARARVRRARENLRMVFI